MLEDAEEFVCHFHFAPQKRLQTLHPFKIRNDHAASVAENVRDHEDFVPVFFENQVRVRRGGTIGSFSEDAALELPGVFSRNPSIDRRRKKNIARRCEGLLWINTKVLVKRPSDSVVSHVL